MNPEKVTDLLENVSLSDQDQEKELELELIICIKTENLQNIETLISNANINAQDLRFNRTALHYSVLKGLYEITERLLTRGAKLDLLDGFGRTPLHYAASEGHQEMVKLFLQKNIGVLNSPDRDGQTPLHFAASENHIKIIEEFLKYDVKLNLQDKAGLTPLYLAALNFNEEAVRVLIRAGAEINVKGSRFDKALPLPTNLISEDMDEIVKILLETADEIENEDYFFFDLHKKEITRDNKRQPSEVNRDQVRQFYARNNKYCTEELDKNKIGKWMLFPKKNKVDLVWDKVKRGIMEGSLWSALVCFQDDGNPHRDDQDYLSKFAIMIFTKDYNDVEDVIRVLNYLETSEIIFSFETIRYKTDLQTYAGIYKGTGTKPWIYSSDTIRFSISEQRHRKDFRASHSKDIKNWRTSSPPKKMLEVQSKNSDMCASTRYNKDNDKTRQKTFFSHAKENKSSNRGSDSDNWRVR